MNPNPKLKQPLPLGRIVATPCVLRLLAEHQCSFLAPHSTTCFWRLGRFGT
jgi:hypothetical protein